MRDEELGVVLVNKRSLDGRLITIYADFIGDIKATITNKNAETTPAFFVKGINSHIDISNEALIGWVRNVLVNNCYFTVLHGDVHVNVRILGGWEWSQVLGVALGLALVAAGIAVIAVTYGAGAVVGGSTLIGAGMNGIAHSINAPEVTVKDYLIEVLKGGAMGAATGGIGLLASEVVPIAKIGIHSVGGLAGELANQVVGSIANGKMDFSASGLVAGAVGGAVGGAIGTVAAVATKAAIGKIESTAAKCLVRSAVGAASGGAKAAVRTAAMNKAKGEDLTKDMLGSVCAGALIEGVITGLPSPPPPPQKNSSTSSNNLSPTNPLAVQEPLETQRRAPVSASPLQQKDFPKMVESSSNTKACPTFVESKTPSAKSAVAVGSSSTSAQAILCPTPSALLEQRTNQNQAAAYNQQKVFKLAKPENGNVNGAQQATEKHYTTKIASASLSGAN